MLNPQGPIIWVVEDDASTQRIVAENLKHNGFSPVLLLGPALRSHNTQVGHKSKTPRITLISPS